jgi:hypothetical protein
MEEFVVERLLIDADGKALIDKQRRNTNKLLRDVRTLQSKFPCSVRDIMKFRRSVQKRKRFSEIGEQPLDQFSDRAGPIQSRAANRNNR